MRKRCQIKTVPKVMGITLLLMVTAVTTMALDDPAQSLLANAIQRFKTVEDYTCRLDKRVRKNGNLYEDLNISVKYKKPQHYYFHWNTGPSAGREVIFVAGQNDDKLVAHPGGFFRFITFHLDPEGDLAMKRNRHSMWHSGMEKIMYLIESNTRQAQVQGLDSIQYLGEARILGKRVGVIEGRFPDNLGFYAHRIIMCMDREIGLPVKVSIFDWSETLIEEYVFNDLKINVGLDKNDFNPANPDYNYFVRAQ